jgi:hypothetical protein
MSDQKKQVILKLLSLDKKKLEALDEDELIKTMERLEQVKADAVKDGRFLDAENAKQKLKLSKDALDKVRKRDAKTRHAIERSKLEEDFALEIKSFTDHWNDKILNYQSECKKMEQELLNSNQTSLDEYRKYLEESIPEKSKDSARLLDMKVQLEQLVRTEEFKDAHYMQQRCYELEAQEQEKYRVERTKKIETLLDQRIAQQQTEYNSLRKRILNGLDELELQRKGEYDRLFLKYNNLKKNIETQQTMQSYALEKSLKTQTLQQSIRNYFTLPANDNLANQNTAEGEHIPTFGN